MDIRQFLDPSGRDKRLYTGLARRDDLGERIDLAVKNTARNTIRTGPGIRGRQTPHGKTLAMNGRTFGWDNPLAVHYYGTKSQINPGTINGQYPTINGRSIKPDAKGQFPLLSMKSFQNAASWVVVEIERNATPSSSSGATAGNKDVPLIKTMEMRHVQNLNDEEINTFFGGALGWPELPGNKTRLPVARIETQQFGNACFQITYFNVQYTIKIINGKVRNYFYPA